MSEQMGDMGGPESGKSTDHDKLSDFQTVVGHALVDANFRAMLRTGSSRGDAVKGITGRDMTPELSAAIDEAWDAIDRVAAQFGDVKAAT